MLTRPKPRLHKHASLSMVESLGRGMLVGVITWPNRLLATDCSGFLGPEGSEMYGLADLKLEFPNTATQIVCPVRGCDTVVSRRRQGDGNLRSNWFFCQRCGISFRRPPCRCCIYHLARNTYIVASSQPFPQFKRKPGSLGIRQLLVRHVRFVFRPVIDE